MYLTLGNHEGFPVNAFPTDAQENSIASGAWLYEVGLVMMNIMRMVMTVIIKVINVTKVIEVTKVIKVNKVIKVIKMICRVLPATNGLTTLTRRRRSDSEGKNLSFCNFVIIIVII